MFPFATGKSQESSSEAVNCYYGAYLWSLVRQRGSNILSDRTDFTRLLLAMEIRGAKTYWHMTPPAVLLNNSDASGIYPPKFQENYMVGNVGMLDVAANTWFGADPLYVHMINAIPITAATALLFEKGYVEEEYPFLMKSRDGVEMAWRGYADSIHSIIDPNLAWEEAQDLVSSELDSALSKSQVLYFISLRPGFDRGSSGKGGEKSNSTTSSSNKHVNPSYSNTTPPSNGDGKSMAASSCENHAECYELDLHGFCCPTASEEFLECCSR